jgi:hypothetical protein
VTGTTNAASVVHTDTRFDNFLFAAIGENKNGISITVLSALAGLNIDPWDEAAELSQLPINAAGQRLASLMSGLPDCSPVTLAPTSIERLIGLLPAGGVAGGFRRSFGLGIFASARTFAIYVVLLAMIFGAQQLWVNAQIRGQIGSYHVHAANTAPSSAPQLK